MSTLSDQKLNLKLKSQEKQLQVVKAIINRERGYAKTQAEASEKRLTKEIAQIKEDIKSLKGK